MRVKETLGEKSFEDVHFVCILEQNAACCFIAVCGLNILNQIFGVQRMQNKHACCQKFQIHSKELFSIFLSESRSLEMFSSAEHERTINIHDISTFNFN